MHPLGHSIDKMSKFGPHVIIGLPVRDGSVLSHHQPPISDLPGLSADGKGEQSTF